MSNEKIENGDRVKHQIHGFSGVVMGTVDYLTGCRQMLVMPEFCINGETPEAHWFDEGTLTMVKSGVYKHLNETTVKEQYNPPNGGLRDDLPKSY